MPEDILETPRPQPRADRPLDGTNWTKIVLAAVLGFGLLVAAAYAGYWYGTESANLKTQSANPQSKTQTPNPVTEATPTPTAPTDEVDETAGWKTYTHTHPTIKYTFKYPSDWIAVEPPKQVDQATSIKNAYGGWLSVSLNMEGFERIITEEQTTCERILSEEQTTVDGRTTAKTVTEGISDGELCDNKGNKTIWISINAGERIHLVSFSYLIESSSMAEKVFDQILSTFKFL